MSYLYPDLIDGGTTTLNANKNYGDAYAGFSIIGNGATKTQLTAKQNGIEVYNVRVGANGHLDVGSQDKGAHKDEVWVHNAVICGATGAAGSMVISATGKASNVYVGSSAVLNISYSNGVNGYGCASAFDVVAFGAGANITAYGDVDGMETCSTNISLDHANIRNFKQHGSKMVAFGSAVAEVDTVISGGVVDLNGVVAIGSNFSRCLFSNNQSICDVTFKDGAVLSLCVFNQQWVSKSVTYKTGSGSAIAKDILIGGNATFVADGDLDGRVFAEDFTVMNNGAVAFSGGVTLKGTWTIQNGANFSVAADLDVNKIDASAVNFVIDLSVATQDAIFNGLYLAAQSYTVELDDNQRSGVYTLASGVDNFAKNMTVKVGEIAKEITLNGDAVTIGDFTCQYTLDNGNVTLTVVNPDASVTDSLVKNYVQCDPVTVTGELTLDNGALIGATLDGGSIIGVEGTYNEVRDFAAINGGMMKNVSYTGGKVFMYGNTTLSNVIIDGGGLSGGYNSGYTYTINDVTLENGELYLCNTATANNLTVNGGSALFHQTPAVNGLHLNGGYVCLSGGGATISGGAMNGGVLSVLRAKAINDFTINGGIIAVKNSAALGFKNIEMNGGLLVLDRTHTAAGAITLANFDLNGGTLNLQSGCRAAGSVCLNLNTGTMRGGLMLLDATQNGDEGVVSVIQNYSFLGGMAYITGNFGLRGTITVGGDAVVSAGDTGTFANDNANLVFDITARPEAARDHEILTGFDNLPFTTFTVMAASDQEFGNYVLAATENFSGSITVDCGGVAGTIELGGEATVVGSRKFALIQDTHNQLVLTVAQGVVGHNYLYFNGEQVEELGDPLADYTVMAGYKLEGINSSMVNVTVNGEVEFNKVGVNNVTVNGTATVVAGATVGGSLTVNSGAVIDFNGMEMAETNNFAFDRATVKNLVWNGLGAATFNGVAISNFNVNGDGAAFTGANNHVYGMTLDNGTVFMSYGVIDNLVMNNGVLSRAGTDGSVNVTLNNAVINDGKIDGRGITFNNVILSGGTIGGKGGGSAQHLRIFGGTVYGGFIAGRGTTEIYDLVMSGGTMANTNGIIQRVKVYDGFWEINHQSYATIAPNRFASDCAMYGGKVVINSNYVITEGGTNAGVYFACNSDFVVSGGIYQLSGGITKDLHVYDGEVQFFAKPAATEAYADSKGIVKLDGKINMYGGKIVTTASEDGGVFSEEANLVLHIEGYEGAKDDLFVDNINKLGAVVDGLCVSVGVGQMNGTYQLVGFSTGTFDSEVTLASEGLQSCYLSVGKTATFGKNYTLRADSGVLSMEVEDGTATACNAEYSVDEDTKGALAAWTEDTLALPGATVISIGNADYAENTLVISGFSNANITVFGDDANDNDMSATRVRVNLNYGEIAAIAAGANSVDGAVGAISVIIGQDSGEPAAKVKAVYAGGFGSVNGDVTTIVNANAEITNGLFGGSRIKFDDNTDEANIAGDVSVTIAGASIGLGERAEGETRCLAAGNYVSGNGTSEIAGDVALTINGGEFFKGNNDCVFVAGYATNGATYNVLGSVNATIMNVTLENGQAAGRGVFGGAFASGSETFVTTGGVNITVDDAEIAGNLFGGGWSQGGAKSNVEGGVNITIINSMVTNVFGGGAHSVNSPNSETLVDGAVYINVDNSIIGIQDGDVISHGAIYAFGQCEGDEVTGDATITISGASEAARIAAAHDGHECGSIYLTFDSFTGIITDSITDVDQVTFSGNGNGTLNTVNGVSDWIFDMSEKTGETAFLNWESGSFAGDNFDLKLNTENVGEWLIVDFDSEGNSIANGNPFEGTQFNLYIDGEAKGGIELDTAITGTGTDFDGMGLKYVKNDDESNGKLFFAAI